MRNVSDKKCVENQSTHFRFNNIFRKHYRLCDNVEKFCRAGQDTDENMAHAHCMMDNLDYNYTHSYCVILIAFELRLLFRESTSVLCYT